MRWIEIEAFGQSKLTKWQKSVAVDDDGTVYLSTELFDNAWEIVMNAHWDGVAIVTKGRHAYLPVDRLIEECPKKHKECRFLESKAREIVQRM